MGDVGKKCIIEDDLCEKRERVSVSSVGKMKVELIMHYWPSHKIKNKTHCCRSPIP